SGVGGSQRPGGLEAPLTGRDGELRTLKELFHSSVSRRSPYLAVVSGPAGVGKSRLGWELEKYIDGLAETMLWHRGRCLSYGEGVSYWALSEIVRRRFGIAEDETVKAASAKLKEGLVRFVTDDTERDYVGVRLARLLGLEYESRDKVVLTKEELFAGWRLFFERLAGVAPVVMLVEDAQHADESLLSFFEHLIDWTRDLPIFVLLFARPGLSAIDAGYGVGRNRSTLSLDPLSDAAMGELVEALVPGMPAPAREAITSRAQGIPLFAVETVRSLLDQGVVSKEDESYRLTGSLGALKVPDSLHGLLAARLDALTQEVRSLVADASVLGSSFSKDGLVAVSGKDEAAVEAGLSDLVRRDVLQVSADPLSPERGRYRFSQEMLRQVAYETLSRTDRKLRHLGVAAHLRTAFAEDGEEVADAIARHYLDALSAVPSDGDEEEITSKALLFLVRAGERAKSSGALQQAATAFSEAARVAPKSEAASLYEKAAEASHDHGDYEAAISFADSAIECYSDQGDGRGAARARAQRGYALSAVGRITEGRAELEEALEVLSLDPDSDTIEALSHLARLEAVSGNFAEGERLASEGLSLSQGLDAGPVLSAGLFIARGLCAAVSNRLIEAVVFYEAAGRLAEQGGDLGLLAQSQSNLADTLLNSDPRSAIEPAASAAAHARRTGQQRFFAVAMTNLAIAQIELGDWDEASASLSEAIGAAPSVSCINGWLGGLRGDTELAANAAPAIATLRSSEDPQTKSYVGLFDALSALLARDQRTALSHGLSVLELEEAIGIGADAMRFSWPLSVRAARSLGDTEVLEKLLEMLEAHPVGHLAPVLRAGRRLLRALMDLDAGPADRAGGGSSKAQPGAHEALDDAVAYLREVANPYELAHGLIDYAGVLARAEVLARAGAGDADADPAGADPSAAAAALAEARD
ncbi:MAG: ATP-binding protein, partial [Acidimicrobiales bacterium]